MAANEQTIKLIITAVNKASGPVKEVKKQLTESEKAAANFGNAMKAALAGLAVAAAVTLIKTMKESIGLASDLNETVSKVGVVFGDSADDIEKFADTAALSLGQSRQSALDAAATFAIFGKGAGLAGAELVNFSTDLVGLSSDLASFANTSPEEAITALGAAMRGESEPIRRYGVLLDDATLRQKALEMGIISTTKNALTPQQRVLAAYEVILDQTGDAQGDFARTSDGLANQQRILDAQMDNLSATLGAKLTPAAIDATSALNGLLTVMNESADAEAVFRQAIKDGIITQAEALAMAGNYEKALLIIEERYAALESATSTSRDGIIRWSGSMKLDAIPALEETKQSAEDLAKILKDELNQQLKNLQSLVDGKLGPSIDEFNEKQGDLQAEIDEVQGKIDALNAKEYLTKEQKEELAELQGKMGELGNKYTENANMHDEATKRILFDLITQRAAVDGLTRDEMAMIADLAEQWGLIDEATAEATKAADQAMINLANGQGMSDVQTALRIQLALLQNIRENVTWLDGMKFQYTVEQVTIGTSGGQGGFTDPGTGSYYAPGGASGLDMVVPPGYPGDTFPVMASSGERVVIVPKNITNNYNMTVNSKASSENVAGNFRLMQAWGR